MSMAYPTSIPEWAIFVLTLCVIAHITRKTMRRLHDRVV